MKVANTGLAVLAKAAKPAMVMMATGAVLAKAANPAMVMMTSGAVLREMIGRVVPGQEMTEMIGTEVREVVVREATGLEVPKASRVQDGMMMEMTGMAVPKVARVATAITGMGPERVPKVVEVLGTMQVMMTIGLQAGELPILEDIIRGTADITKFKEDITGDTKTTRSKLENMRLALMWVMSSDSHRSMAVSVLP